MRARLADVAAHAGVGEATVSRVLNGRPEVAEATRRIVLASLDVLGYSRPAQLVTRSVGQVGLVLPELDDPCSRPSPR
jgi:DNA-binding LacI/PurR family transcriptional regulator